MAMESGTVAGASPPSAVVLLSTCEVAVALSDRAGPTQRFSTSAHIPMVSYSLAKNEPCRSILSISYGVTYLTPSPIQTSGILIFRLDPDALSWVTTVCCPARACATR